MTVTKSERDATRPALKITARRHVWDLFPVAFWAFLTLGVGGMLPRRGKNGTAVPAAVP